MRYRSHKLQRRYGRSGGAPGETRYWAYLVGFKGPIPIWATSLEKAYKAAGATAYAYRTTVSIVTLSKEGGS